jgi:hypothetical protein
VAARRRVSLGEITRGRGRRRRGDRPLDVVEMLAAVVVAVEEERDGRAFEGGDEIVGRRGDQRVEARGRVEGELRHVGGVDAGPVRVERVVREMLGLKDGVAIGGPLAREHLLPSIALPAIPEAGMGERGRDRPAIAQVDRQLGRSQRRDEAGKPFSGFVVLSLEAPVHGRVSKWRRTTRPGPE